jgi:hypothetical protein
MNNQSQQVGLIGGMTIILVIENSIEVERGHIGVGAGLCRYRRRETTQKEGRFMLGICHFQSIKFNLERLLQTLGRF